MIMSCLIVRMMPVTVDGSGRPASFQTDPVLDRLCCNPADSVYDDLESLGDIVLVKFVFADEKGVKQ